MAPYLDLGAIAIVIGYRPVFDKDPDRPCPSSPMRLQTRKLENIARFQSKVGTVLMGRKTVSRLKTICGVILREDEY
jgi:hypothetical protein